MIGTTADYMIFEFQICIIMIVSGGKGTRIGENFVDGFAVILIILLVQSVASSRSLYTDLKLI